MKAFAYQRVRTLAEAAAGALRPLAGGTDLLPLLKEGLMSPETLADLTSVSEPDARRVAAEPDGGLRIGALVTLADLARDPRVRQGYPVLAEASGSSATPQIRNVATLAGNLCQWNRCWYLRGGIPCHLNGGADCPAARGDHRYHAIHGHGPCIAVHPSDPAVALVALGASVEIGGPAGQRCVEAAAFLRPPRPGSPEQTVLAPGEVVTAVVLGAPRGASCYEKAMDRKAWAFALVSAAAVVRIDGGVVAHAEIALGGVAGVPWRAEACAAQLRGRPLRPETIAAAAALAADGARPLPGNAYKVDLAQAVVRSALTRLLPAG